MRMMDWLDPEDRTAIEQAMEMPARISRLHKENDELYVVLVDGRSICVTDLVKRRLRS